MTVQLTQSGQPANYNATALTLNDMDPVALQVDVKGNLKVSNEKLTAGEDLTNDVLKVEERYSYAYCTADTAVKSGAGFIHAITFSPTDAAATAGSIITYDNTAESGTILNTYYIPAAALVPVTIVLDVAVGTGIYIGFTTTADVNVCVSYR